MPDARGAPRPLSRCALPIVFLGAVGAGLVGSGLGARDWPAPQGAARVVPARPAFDASPLIAAATAGAQAQAVAPVPPKPAPRKPTRASRSRTAPMWTAPLLGRLTSPFGWRWGRTHEGVDLAVPVGTAVRAAGPGIVLSAGRDGGYGNLITVLHVDGTVTAYAHLAKILVSVGQKVIAGQRVGLSGNTGQSTGPHLHFEVRRGGTQVNPLAWLAERGVRL